MGKYILTSFNESLFKTDNKIKKYEKLFIDSVIEFFKSKFNFDAKIIVKKKDSSSLIGDISLSNASVNNNKFTLHYSPKQSYIQILKTLIHELTHIKQVSKRELKPSEDWKSILWKDNFEITVKEYNKLDLKSYMDLPWEKEAHSNMSDDSLIDEFLSSKYFKDLKGKDLNLDFIIDNIK